MQMPEMPECSVYERQHAVREEILLEEFRAVDLPLDERIEAQLRISRMSVHGFIACRANISVDVGPRFHGMPVQDDADRGIVSESSFGVNDC
jgi:hypothetical protein